MTSSWIWNLKLWIANLTVFLLKAGEEVLVGGQAVFEGVMMRSPKSYSIAVRKPDGTIVVKKDYLPRPADRRALVGISVDPRHRHSRTGLYVGRSCTALLDGPGSQQPPRKRELFQGPQGAREKFQPA